MIREITARGERKHMPKKQDSYQQEITRAITLLERAKKQIDTPNKVVLNPGHLAETARGRPVAVREAAARFCLLGALWAVIPAARTTAVEEANDAVSRAAKRRGFVLSRDDSPANHPLMMKIYDSAIRSLRRRLPK